MQDVLACVGSTLDSAASAGVKSCALRCLASWLHAGVLLSELATEQPKLFQRLVQDIGREENGTVNALQRLLQRSRWTAMQKVANRTIRVWHGATENGP